MHRQHNNPWNLASKLQVGNFLNANNLKSYGPTNKIVFL